MNYGQREKLHIPISSKAILPLAILLALLCGALLLAISGYPPIEAYMALLRGSLGNLNSIAEVLVKTTPLLITALGPTISNRAQVISIGAEGQICLGAMGAAAVGLFLGPLPGYVAIPLCMAAGIAVGALWGGIAGYLKVRANANEVIVTLLMNYIAMNLVSYLVTGPWRDPSTVEPFTALITPGAYLPTLIPGTRLHVGILIALAMVVLFWLLLRRTTLGYRFTVFGASPTVAEANGINGKRIILLSMLISGGMAGLAGAIELTGIHHRLLDGVSSNYGFTAIIIAVLGRGKPGRVLLASLFFAILTVGADAMRRSLGIPVAVGTILQALVLLFALGSEIYEQHLLTKEQLRVRTTQQMGES